ncbi:hypothetical protein [Aeromonas hydrophila]|uniref:hypothetical protein n=1 Tax=Aeromonas hydrophila TaxID=644 RepID=UPI002442D192|nr:hypothetical protein [Aeromonas hydrophila]
MFGTIKEIKDNHGEITFSVIVDDGRHIQFLDKDYKDQDGRLPITLGYALTVYASQGITIDGDTFIYWTNGMDRANSYVAGSRHKDNCHWFFNNQELDLISSSGSPVCNNESERINAIAKTMSFDRRKHMAIEFDRSESVSTNSLIEMNITRVCGNPIESTL